MSDIKSISVIDTAKLIRTSLREAFPKVKFGVRSNRAALCSSVHVRWTDGPNTAQVNAVINRFQSTYYDTAADYWKPIYHRLRGIKVSFGSDIVAAYRRHSDEWIAAAIDSVYEQHQAYLESQAFVRPSLEDYFTGRLHDIWLGPEQKQVDPNEHWLFAEMIGPRYPTMYEAVRDVLANRADDASSKASAMAMAVTLVASDNPAANLVEAGWACSMH